MLDDPHPMAQPVGAAERDGLVNRRQPERLSGVNHEAGIIVSHVFEGVEMPRWRIAGLRPAMSKPTTPLSRKRIASSAISSVLLLIALRVSDDREAASVVDDEESPFVTAGEGDDAFRLH